ncbi:hypothetical protein F0562_032599 [Nyssa sinensis]|uniref:Uncharacterized protein n=1 Tax=Nyssa sinensis TaxID=561372 RepID=A0A5J5AN85_9ASTE|nr:hypothetical protein F0562_032599 [Nyssa sinensis]
MLIVETHGIPCTDQPGFSYAVGTAPREEVLTRTLCCDRSVVFQVIGVRFSHGLLSQDYHFLNLVVSYDLSPMSHTNTLTRSYSILLYAIATRVLIDEAYVIFTAIDSAVFRWRTIVLPFVDVDAAEDMEVNTIEAGGVVPDEDYVVDQTPPQYRRASSSPRPFYSDSGAFSSSVPHSPITRGDLEEYF